MHSQRQKIWIHLSIPVGNAYGYVYFISVHWISSTIPQDDFSVHHHTFLVYAVPVYSWDLYEYDVTDRNLTDVDRLESSSIHPPSLTYDSLLSDIVESRDSSLVFYTDHLSISPDRSTRVLSSSSEVHNYLSLSDLPISSSANEYIPIRRDSDHPIDLRSSRQSISAHDRHAFDALSNNSFVSSRSPILISGARNFNPVSEMDYSGSSAADSRNRIETSALSAIAVEPHINQSANENEQTHFFHNNTVFGPTAYTMRQTHSWTHSPNCINVTMIGSPEQINDRHIQVFSPDMHEPNRSSIFLDNFDNNEPNENNKHDCELSANYQKNKQEPNIQNNVSSRVAGCRLGDNSDCNNPTPTNWASNWSPIAEALQSNFRDRHRSVPFQERPRPPEMCDYEQVEAASKIDEEPRQISRMKTRSMIRTLQTFGFSKIRIDRAIQSFKEKTGNDNYSLDDLVEILTTVREKEDESDNDSV